MSWLCADMAFSGTLKTSTGFPYLLTTCGKDKRVSAGRTKAQETGIQESRCWACDRAVSLHPGCVAGGRGGAATASIKTRSTEAPLFSSTAGASLEVRMRQSPALQEGLPHSLRALVT